MHDIYHELVMHTPDFDKHSAEDLQVSRDLFADGVFAITSALTLIGNLTLDATMSENYGDEDARRDLALLGGVLRHLPRMATALEQNSSTADFVLKHRREGNQ